MKQQKERNKQTKKTKLPEQTVCKSRHFDSNQERLNVIHIPNYGSGSTNYCET